MFTQDFVLNGKGHGEVAETMAGLRFDAGMLRPFVDEKGRPTVTINTGKMVYDKQLGYARPERRDVLIKDLKASGIDVPVWNATLLRKEDWIQLDRAVSMPVRQRQRAWSDLMANSTFGGFNAMAKSVLEYEAMSDPGSAVVDMDGLGEGPSSTPKFQLQGLPLPITHSDFFYTKRKLMISQASGTPLDTRMGEAAGTRVAEMVEKTTIGTETGATYGGTGPYASGSGMVYPQNSTVYGYLNAPYRSTNTSLTIPTGSNPETTVSEVLALRNTLYGNNYFGPFMIYHSTDWDTYLDNDYARLGGNNANMTLRDRLRRIEGVLDVRRLDFLTPAASHAFVLLIVQMTSQVCRAVNGMSMTTIQWETRGGLQLNFKVMCIQVPQIFVQYNGSTYGSTGVMHARTA